MKQVSSLDLHLLVNELQFLLDGKIDKIFQSDKEETIFAIHVPNKGKLFLKVITGKSLFLSEKKPSGQPSGFCMFLRKHIDNARIRSIAQLCSERIVVIDLEKKDKYQLVLEFFGKGNVLLLKDGVILSAINYKIWKDRAIKPNEKYKAVEKGFDLFKLTFSEFEKLLSESKEECLVKFLAADLGLGKVYSEEICIRLNLDKNTSLTQLKENKKIFNEINNLIKETIKPMIVKSDSTLDIIPFELQYYGGYSTKEYATLSDAYDNFVPEKKEENKEIKRLKHIIVEQEKSIVEMEKKQQEMTDAANYIYNNYQTVQHIITQVNAATKKLSAKEIKDRLKGHNIIKNINFKDKSVEL